MLRKASLILTLTLLFSALSFGQADSETVAGQDSKNPIKFTEFGRVGECELSAQVDAFFSELNDKPTATGYIIIYQGTDVLPADYDSTASESRIRRAVRFRNFDMSRVVFIKGGFRNELMNEFWIAPAGADAPTPTDTVAKPTLPKGKTYLFDSGIVGGSYDGAEDSLAEFILPSVQAGIDEQNRIAEEEWKKENPETEESTQADAPNEEEMPVESPPTQAEIDEQRFSWASNKFGEILKKQKNANGVIIFYADDTYYDAGKLQTFIDEGRNRIAEQAKISSDRIQVIFGGYRNSVEAEFWIMPKKGEFPTPTPEQKEVENKENEESK